MLILYTCACTYSGEIGGEGGEESIGRESNYVLLKLNVIDIMHSYFRVIRALQPRSDSPRYTFPFSPFPFVKNHRQRQGTSISIQIDICSNQTASLVSSFLPFSLPSLLFSLPRGIGFNSKCGGCKSNGKWRDDNDGWMDGWMEPRVWRSSYKNRSGKKKWNEMFSRGFGFPSDQCGNVCLFNEESIALLFHHP